MPVFRRKRPPWRACSTRKNLLGTSASLRILLNAPRMADVGLPTERPPWRFCLEPTSRSSARRRQLAYRASTRIRSEQALAELAEQAQRLRMGY